MTAQRKLARHVTVAGTTYGPGDTVPDDVAKQITNPKAWLPADHVEDETTDPEGRPAGTTSGRKLASTVTVGGRSYGPRDHIPDDVAKQITNPKAWEGGKVPSSTTAADAVSGDAAPKKAAPVKAAPGKATDGGK